MPYPISAFDSELHFGEEVRANIIGVATGQIMRALIYRWCIVFFFDL